MSDIKRAILTTLEPQKVNDKAVKKQCKTVRICVTLPESNEDKCPEYNYKDELAAAKKKVKQNSKEPTTTINGADPFDNDDDVRRIALEMEAKYGSGMSGPVKKRRKGRKDDYVDIGAGYDESDSFIDNTDGYDEIIPPNVTTVRGGFYINSGALEFKTDDEVTSELSSNSSEEESGTDEEKDGKEKKKRPLDTSDEEEVEAADTNGSTESQMEKKQKADKANISMQQAIKKKLFSTEKIQVKKQRLSEQLKLEKRIEFNSDNVDKDSAKENKKPVKLSSIDDVIESVINRTEEVQKSPEKNENKHVELDDDRPRLPSDADMGNDTIKVEIVKLPENLPKDIVEIIDSIKKAAREYKDGGKVKFFNGDVNIMLLNLESKCKILGRSSRVKVYEHLAPFVRCRKETLIKRAKNLVIEDEQRKLRRTLEKLKNHIDHLMPSQMASYEKECQRVLQKKFSQEAVNNEELKNLKAPRRRFLLSEDTKRMIRDIVNLKKRCLLHEGKRKDDLELLLTEYLKKDIIVLWPEGWMSMIVLKKFCSTAALKTPNPKAIDSTVSSKHSQKPQVSSSSVINFSSGNNLTITPVNLTEKFNELSNNNIHPNVKLDTIIKPIVKDKEKAGERRIETIKTIRPIDKEKLDIQKESKDNGVIVINTTKNKEDTVIPKTTHCQVIDLTDTPMKSAKLKSIEESSSSFQIIKEHSEPTVIGSFENSLKAKYPDVNILPSTDQNDIENVQKVIDSLKALHKLSSPSKKDGSKSSSVSVIALNKNYSNSNSSHNSGGATNNERTNFVGALGFQDEFQKQLMNSLSNLKSPPHSSKSSYNRCS